MRLELFGALRNKTKNTIVYFFISNISIYIKPINIELGSYNIHRKIMVSLSNSMAIQSAKKETEM